MSYYPPMQNPFMMPFQQQAQPQQTQNIKTVNGKASVENYYLPVNSSDIFMDEGNKKFYTKYVDASGVSSIKSYDYTESEEEKPKEYVTKEEFESFKATLKGGKHESNTNSNGK